MLFLSLSQAALPFIAIPIDRGNVFISLLRQNTRAVTPLRVTCNRGLLTTVMRRLTTGIRSEKCVVRLVRRYANVVECTYANPETWH